jgi:hypothetical protein
LGQQLQGMSNAQQPFQQTNAFQQGMGGALGGQGGFQDISGAGGMLQKYFQGGGGGGMANLSQFGTPQTAQTAQFGGTGGQGYSPYGGGMIPMRQGGQESQSPQMINSMAAPAGQAGIDRHGYNPGFGPQGAAMPLGGGGMTPMSGPQAQNFTGQQQNQQSSGLGMANLSGFGNAAQAAGTGMSDLSGFGNAAQSQFNTQGPIGSQFNDMLMSMIQRGGNMQAQSGYAPASAGAAVEMTPQMSYQQAYNTLGEDPLMQRERQRAVAEQRARFGAEGAGALGTGAQYAESNLNAELAARDASMRRQQSMQLMGQDLSGQQALANVGLQNRGQNLQASMANTQAAGQAAANVNNFNATNLGNLLQAAGQGRGQDFSTAIQQLGLGAQQGQFNAGQQNAMQQAMMQGQLQNQGMGNQQGQFNAGQQNQMQQAMMNAMLQNQGMGNQVGMFNTGQQNQMNQFNAGQGNQMQQAMLQAQLQNQQMGNQFGLGMLGQGMNMNQLGMQGSQFGLGQLFNAFNQANQLGTAQRNTTVTPNPWMQALQVAGQFAGGFRG